MQLCPERKLTDRHAHTQQSHSPPSKDASNKNHSQIFRRSLQNRSYQTNKSTHLDSHLPPKSIHGKSTHQRAKDGTAIEGAVYRTDDGGCFDCVEVFEEIVRSDHIGHHTGIVAEEE